MTSRSAKSRSFTRLAVVGAIFIPMVAACSAGTRATTITMVAYDSFPKSGTSLNEALAGFTRSTGITVEIVTAGDTGTMVQKAILTSGNPEGDVMWGVDNTLMSAANDGKIFLTDPIDVDFGDVCVNYDLKWFDDHHVAPPTSLDDLLKPEYKDLLVVENPATSSPGLAFLLATVARYGVDGWQQYWTALRHNGVEVSDSWDTAYVDRFSGSAGSKGDKPLVVSYGSSPPAEVVFANPPITTAPTGVAADTCFRQTEYVGILRGTKHLDASRKLLDFLVGTTFQKELPLNLFVYPVNKKVALPDVFTKFAVVPKNPWFVGSDAIAQNRQRWQEQWTQIVLR